MKKLISPIVFALGLTACASSSPVGGDIDDARFADPRYAYQDEGLGWWRRNWVQPYAFFRRTSYNASNWQLIDDPQASSWITLQLSSQIGDQPGPDLEFRCRNGVTSFVYRDVTVFSPFHSFFEMFIDAENEPRWVTIARRTAPRSLSIEDPELAARALLELESAANFTIAVRDATPVRARFVVAGTASSFSEFRSRCASQLRALAGSDGSQ